MAVQQLFIGPRKVPKTRSNRSVPKVAEAATEFLLSRRVQRCTDSTLRAYSYVLSRLQKWPDVPGNLADLSEGVLRRYFGYLATGGLSDHSLAHHRLALRAFLRWCHREGLLDRVPDLPAIRVERKVLAALTPLQAQAFLKAAADSIRDLALCSFLLDSGARIAEAAAMTVADFDPATGAAKLLGKGRKQRVVYVGASTRLHMTRYLRGRREATPMWIGRRGPLTVDGLRQVVYAVAERAGLVGVSPHALRRTCAVTMLRAGAPVHVVQRQLGHADIQVLRCYLPLVEQDMQAASEAFGAVAALTTGKLRPR